VNFKGDVFLLEITPRPAQKDGAEIVQRSLEWLARDFGFAPDSKRLWRDGCFEPYFSRRSFSNLPIARNNALLVGNAAGLIKPVTGEGISTAIKSGLMAAEAIIRAQQQDRKAEEFYLPEAQSTFAPLDTLYPPPGTMRENVRKGMECFLEVQRDIFSRSISIL
jgi:flavin-dependent dehydrogenase